MLGLEPETLALIDLPDRKERVERVLGRLGACPLEGQAGKYDSRVDPNDEIGDAR